MIQISKLSFVDSFAHLNNQGFILGMVDGLLNQQDVYDWSYEYRLWTALAFTNAGIIARYPDSFDLKGFMAENTDIVDRFENFKDLERTIVDLSVPFNRPLFYGDPTLDEMDFNEIRANMNGYSQEELAIVLGARYTGFLDYTDRMKLMAEVNSLDRLVNPFIRECLETEAYKDDEELMRWIQARNSVFTYMELDIGESLSDDPEGTHYSNLGIDKEQFGAEIAKFSKRFRSIYDLGMVMQNGINLDIDSAFRGVGLSPDDIQKMEEFLNRPALLGIFGEACTILDRYFGDEADEELIQNLLGLYVLGVFTSTSPYMSTSETLPRFLMDDFRRSRHQSKTAWTDIEGELSVNFFFQTAKFLLRLYQGVPESMVTPELSTQMVTSIYNTLFDLSESGEDRGMWQFVGDWKGIERLLVRGLDSAYKDGSWEERDVAKLTYKIPDILGMATRFKFDSDTLDSGRGALSDYIRWVTYPVHESKYGAMTPREALLIRDRLSKILSPIISEDIIEVPTYEQESVARVILGGKEYNVPQDSSRLFSEPEVVEHIMNVEKTPAYREMKGETQGFINDNLGPMINNYVESGLSIDQFDRVVIVGGGDLEISLADLEFLDLNRYEDNREVVFIDSSKEYLSQAWLQAKRAGIRNAKFIQCNVSELENSQNQIYESSQGGRTLYLGIHFIYNNLPEVRKNLVHRSIGSVMKEGDVAVYVGWGAQSDPNLIGEAYGGHIAQSERGNLVETVAHLYGQSVEAVEMLVLDEPGLENDVVLSWEFNGQNWLAAYSGRQNIGDLNAPNDFVPEEEGYMMKINDTHGISQTSQFHYMAVAEKFFV